MQDAVVELVGAIGWDILQLPQSEFSGVTEAVIRPNGGERQLGIDRLQERHCELGVAAMMRYFQDQAVQRLA